jgi:uncharacterized membrane protein YqhA
VSAKPPLEGEQRRTTRSPLNRLLSASRFVIIIAVVCTFIVATTLLVYGGVETFQIVTNLLTKGSITDKSAKQLILDCIELTDLFLLGTVLYVISVGLYELFIDDNLPLPAWLEIHNLDDLKNKLIAVVVVVLGVAFLGQVVSWDGERDLIRIGAPIALVVAALTYFLSQKVKKPDGDSKE